MLKACNQSECLLFNNGRYPIVKFQGNNKAQIVVVGEPPNFNDTKAGYNFSGDGWAKMEIYLKTAGLSPDDVFFASICRCQINKKDMPVQKQRDSVVEICKKFAIQVIQKLQPKVVVVMGDAALKALTGKQGITKDHVHGKAFWSGDYNCWIFPVFGLGYIWRNEGKEYFVHRDFADLKVLIDSGYKNTEVEIKKPEMNFTELQSLREYYKGKMQTGIAVDTETQGLKWYNDPFVCLGYSICAGKEAAHWIQLFEETDKEHSDFSIIQDRQIEESRRKVTSRIYVKRTNNFEQKLKELKFIMESPEIPKFMHHGSFDIHAMQKALQIGGTLLNWTKDQRSLNVQGWVVDTQFLAHVYDENIFKLASLEKLQDFFLRKEFPYNYNKIFGDTHDKSDMLRICKNHKQDFVYYASCDSYITWMLTQKLLQWFRKPENKKLYNYIKEFGKASYLMLTEMETNGLLADHAKVPEAQKEVSARQAALQEKIVQLMPPKVREKYIDDLRISRDVIMREAFYDKTIGFGLPIKQVTSTSGAPSVSKNVRKLLLEEVTGIPFDFITAYHEYEKLDTIRTRYLKSLAADFGTDGMLHSSLSLCNTDTGRSCLTGDTLICVPAYSAAGLYSGLKHKALKDIQVGDIVYCLSHNNRLTVSTVSQAGVTLKNAEIFNIICHVKNKHARCYDVINITGTADHPLKEYKRNIYTPAKSIIFNTRLRTFHEDITAFFQDCVTKNQYTDVYDITVEKHHNFILASGICVHNSSKEPNMQNMPKRGGKDAADIRRLIIPPPGYEMLKADESQAELRWAAVLSGDEVMKDVFRKDGDIHVTTGERLAGKPWDQLSDADKKKYRQNAKPVNFGLLYMMSAKGFQLYAKLEYGLDLSIEQSERMIEIYFETYKMLPDYHQKTISFGERYGYVETPFGRRRRLPELKSSDRQIRNEAQRKAVNVPIQGASSDLVILAGNEILKLDLPKKEIKLCMFIHDELVFIVKEGYGEKYAPIVKKAMEHPPLHKFGIKLDIPLRSDVSIGKNFYDCQEVKFDGYKYMGLKTED